LYARLFTNQPVVRIVSLAYLVSLSYVS